MKDKLTFAGGLRLEPSQAAVTGEFVEIQGEKFYRVSNFDHMAPFFMSLVSDSDHWMFISSLGGLTTGRKNPENAIFPYVTDDKIHDACKTTGSRSILLVMKEQGWQLWEPFSDSYKGVYSITRNIYKNMVGNKLVFEEINHDLEMIFRYAWMNSERYGFVKRTQLENIEKNPVSVNILDGIQNILPSGLNRNLQTNFSTLVDAYKKNEILPGTGIGIYTLSSIPVDKAEPSESLKATVTWSTGLEPAIRLLSSMQVDQFLFSHTVREENEKHAIRGAYFLNAELRLAPGEEKTWYTIIDINKDQADVASLEKLLGEKTLNSQTIEDDIRKGCRNLEKIVANADGFQHTADELSSGRHFSNVLFNVMRGGIFDSNYTLEKADFLQFFERANKVLFKNSKPFLDSLPDELLYPSLLSSAENQSNPDLVRICYEYLPLTFSRRHGDPSRPWNIFSIETRKEDGSKILYYQGNWRDIFQNWEALAISFPGFIESMICKFVNASTPDGYNPYRITRDGFDWELLDPADPWSNIGYWGDHQVIYLLRLLELSVHFHPGKLDEFLEKKIFSYANIPYRIRPYEALVKNPKNTIEFDDQLQLRTTQRTEEVGSDGKLFWRKDNAVVLVNLNEKILATLLSKFTCFIPEGGIWMNTQRPEWNDANNALVGNGISMVTLYYMRRFIVFYRQLLEKMPGVDILLSEELAGLFHSILGIFSENTSLLERQLSGSEKKQLLDQLGKAGSEYRQKIYAEGFSGREMTLLHKELLSFCRFSGNYIDHSIQANKRADSLYHAYNIVRLGNGNSLSINHLYEMLEGQVALISSGYLDPAETLDLLSVMRKSSLYREDQNSYMLYPERKLPLFTGKNIIAEEDISRSSLLQQLIRDGDHSIVIADTNGSCHFHSSFRNAEILSVALDKLKGKAYSALIEKETNLVLEIYEKVFNHAIFTGRSGTFYKYEGLGSIYWHMVSKLLLSVNEVYFHALLRGENQSVLDGLYNAYYEIRAGIGVNKSPELYGAFPTDPYSHTPRHAGVQQPGMTGQVKEDIISRFGELGVSVKEGCIQFLPSLLRRVEFISQPGKFRFYNLEGQEEFIALDPGSLAFTYCQVPVIYRLSVAASLVLHTSAGGIIENRNLVIDRESSAAIFMRNRLYSKIEVFIEAKNLR